MKMYAKENLVFKDGLLIADDDIVAIDPVIVDMANELEEKLQKARYLAAQPKCNPAPSLAGFERKSARTITPFTCETPITDKQAEESVAFMNEVDDIQMTRVMNDMLFGMEELILFVLESEVVGMDVCPVLHRFDTPELGNPLTWTEDTIARAVAEINGCEVIFDDDEEQAEVIFDDNEEQAAE